MLHKSAGDSEGQSAGDSEGHGRFYGPRPITRLVSAYAIKSMCKIFSFVDVTDLGKTHLPATFETKRGVLQVLLFWDICLKM